MRPLPTPPALQAVLLDAGNTLVFLDHAVVAEIARRQGEPLTEEGVRRAEAPAKRAYESAMRDGGSHADGWFLHMGEVYRHAGVDEAAIEPLVQHAWEEHMRFNLWRRVPADLVQALTRLRAAGLAIGVVSNAEGTLMALLERVGLSEHLDVVLDSTLEGVRKPDPRIFLRAAERLGVEPARCVYAGDIPDVDVGGARAAGIAAVLIDPFGHYADFDQAPRVPSVAALTDLLL